MRNVNVLAVHAEKLHDRAVASATLDVAERLRAAGIRATFLVYPERAKLAGQDVREPVRELGDLGHEIGQHTHLYRGRSPDRPGQDRPGNDPLSKAVDPSYSNVRACILRDLESLGKAGVVPQGFSAGGWLVPDFLFELIAELGFAYDCSTRVGPPPVRIPVPGWRQLERPLIREYKSGSIALLPTHTSVRRWMLDAGKCTSSVRIFYCHDYDLVAWKERALLQACWRILGAGSFCSAGQAAQSLVSNGAVRAAIPDATSANIANLEERVG